MTKLHVGTTAFAGLATLGILFGAGASPARAQGWSYGGTPAYPSSYAWYHYPRTSGWGGYAPARPWAGYAPAPVPQPPGRTYWRGYGPGTAREGYAPTTSALPGGLTRYYTPARPSVSAPRPAAGSRPRTPPSQYREPGTGRDIFMHKPRLQ
jgi:hypothetical protein